MAEISNRYTVLDSYRALAALYVVCFHYFYRWTNIAPSEQLIPPTPILSSSDIIQHGYLGVEFFFIISGFVIALTLSKTSTFADFIVKRFARLFPAMFVCATFTFVAVLLLRVAPFSDVALVDFLPSLTFIAPSIYNQVLGIDSHWISGVYWSLFIEVKFYFYAAIIYFALPRQFLSYFVLFATVVCGIYWYSVFAGLDAVGNFLTLVFFPKYAFLFIAGMTFYELHESKSRPRKSLIAILAASLIYSMLVYSPLSPTGVSSAIPVGMIFVFHMLFVLFLVDARILSPLNSRKLAKIGAASYSLYLLHESIGVSIIRRLNVDIATSIYWPFLTVAIVILISIVFYDYIESPARRYIRAIYESRRSKTG